MTICEQCGQRLARDASANDYQSVAELEAEMSQIEELMERLAHQRTLLRRKINALSPTARLPPEILIEIFHLACQSIPPIPDPSSSLQASQTTFIQSGQPSSTIPLFLGSVCVEWRALAWSTPLLWSTVSLNISRTRHNSQLQLLSEWLPRARTTPLHIRLTSNDEHESIFYSLRAIMDVLVTRSMYWGSIDCLLPPQCHDVLANNHFPILTSVCLKPPKGTISTFSQPPDMFRSAPLLAEVDLSGYDFSSMILPWDQLRKFRTQFLTVAECVKVLRRSPNLVQCFLDNVYSPDIFPPATSQLVHSHLRSLEVTLIKGAAMSLLDTISLPSLKEIMLHYVGMEHVPLLPVISLVSRSSCQLETLCISRSILAEDDLIRCLEAIPSLKDVQVSVLPWNLDTATGLSENIVKRLCPSKSSNLTLSTSDTHYSPPTTFLPNLHSFTYEGPVTCSSAVMMDMLTWRWNPKSNAATTPPSQAEVAQLKSATIVSQQAYSIGEKEMEQFRRLVGEGMEVCFRSLAGAKSLL